MKRGNRSFGFCPPLSKNARRPGSVNWHYEGAYVEHCEPALLAAFFRDPSLLPKRPPPMPARALNTCARARDSHEND